MKKQVYEITENGFINDIYVATIEDGNIIDEDKQGFITVDYPNNIFKPKWDGEKWVEGESIEEKTDRESKGILELLKPSQNEITDAELEIKMLTILTELGVIQ